MRINFICLTLAACFATGTASATDLYVTSTADDGSAGTLRSQIAAANPGDTIRFSLTYPATIQLAPLPSASRYLNIDKSLTIAGPGPSQLTIVGYSVSNGYYDAIDILQPQGAPTDLNVALSGVTIRNSAAAISSSGYAWGTTHTMTITLQNVALVNNFAGMYADFGAKVNISQSTISDNYTGVSALSDGTDPDSAVTITQSTLSGNYGAVTTRYATTRIINSTLAGNGTYGSGRYASAVGDKGSKTIIVNSTIVGDSSTVTPGLLGLDSSAVFTLKNTIIAAHAGGNCSLAGATAVSLGFNLDSDGTCGLTGAGDTKGTVASPLNPVLGGLASNGGPTQTLALLPGSPAIDAIPLSNCTDDLNEAVTTDQRGTARPIGFGCDTGAFESANGSAAAISAKLDLSGPTRSSTSFTLNATFQTNAVLDPTTQSVSLQIGGYHVTISPGSFSALKNGSKTGAWVYAGVIGGVTLNLQIVPGSGGTYQFKANGGLINAGTVNPIPVTISIGSFTGSASI